MRVYVCMTDCYGYQGKYWRAGQTVMVNESDPKPPVHFKPQASVAALPVPAPVVVEEDDDYEPSELGKPVPAESASPSPLARTKRKYTRK